MTPAPLATWRFDGTLRTYQAEVLSQLPVGAAGPLHIVAPPGSGKTLLGLLLAMREGHRALVLAPTTTIRRQWVTTARSLAGDAEAVSDDDPADLTALTYQALSVVGDGAPFDGLARAVWVDELVEAGRTDAAAETMLAELSVDNPKKYRAGIRRRVRRLRREFARRRPEELAKVLHPNAVEAMERLVAAGVRTIVLDECHHLLDHWALVVSYLAARIRETGVEPLLIGLTATLPSPDDEREFENYTQLLGEVDYEVPTPAVVKEGHLAPYRDHVLFTEPTEAEARFIRRHEQLLHELIVQILTTPDGVGFLAEKLQPGEGEPAERLERALADDFAFARACAVVLGEIAPQHPLAGAVPPVLLDRCSTDDLLTVLARFAHERLLADPGAHQQWEHVRRSLADFGYRLTDRGIRRGPSPVQTALSYSEAKDLAAVEILRRELTTDAAEQVRAVVVTDFVEHGNHRGELGAEPAGALRAFAHLASDVMTAGLHPVLVTSQHLRTTDADAAGLAAALSELLGEPVSVEEGFGAVRSLRTAAGSGRVVAALSELIRRGEVRLLVGTRGMLGEGWDCPAVNTLIDLTAAATSSATQQLRGRTLRLDPAWPEKVAHNWSVTCLIPPFVALDDTSEPDRLERKHSHLLGLSADDDGVIVGGLAHALPRAARKAYERVLDKDASASLSSIDEASPLPPRSLTRAQWRIGSPYVSAERERITVRRSEGAPLLRTAPAATGDAVSAFIVGAAGFGTAGGIASSIGMPGGTALILGAAAVGGVGSAASTALPALRRALQDRRRPGAVYEQAAVAVARTLREAGRIGQVDESRITAVPDGPGRVRIEIGGASSDRRRIADAVEELFGAVGTPRFLLRIDRAHAARSRFWARIADRLSPGRTLLPVPRLIARRRSDAERFAAVWAQLVGPCELHELRGAKGLALVRVARSSESRFDPAEPRTVLCG